MLWTFKLTAVAFFLALVEAVPAADLEAEVPVLVKGEPLDVEHLGEANPWVVDFDGDGKKDLLVGHGYRTTGGGGQRIQRYLNVGTSAVPRFEPLDFKPDATPSGYLSIPGSYSPPQLVDLNGDGRRDLITSDWPFEVFISRGMDDGRFGQRENVIERGRFPIDGSHVGLHVVDWDGDSDFDFVVGGGFQETELGNVRLLRNVGDAKQFKVDQPEPILAEGKPIMAQEYNAAPVVADWDGDGKSDLILGCGDGSVLWFQNKGSRESPAFATGQTLVPPPAGLTERGKQARPCVVDWNDDGRLDLIVGDYGGQFEKVLSADESQWQQQARTKQAEILAAWASVFKRYRDSLALLKAAPGDELLYKPEIDQLRERLSELNAERGAYQQQEHLLQPGLQRHGRVWLFLRKSP